VQQGQPGSASNFGALASVGFLKNVPKTVFEIQFSTPHTAAGLKRLFSISFLNKTSPHCMSYLLKKKVQL